MTEFLKLLKELSGPLLVGAVVGALFGLLAVYYIQPYTSGGIILLFCVGVLIGVLVTYLLGSVFKLFFRRKEKESTGNSTTSMDKDNLPST